MSSTGFSPPPYPYERLREVAVLAEAHEGGAVDLSIGTPCDPPPAAVLQALAGSNTERSYPPSAGTEPLREAAVRWMDRRFGVHVSAEHLAAAVGTKELVASTAHYLRLRDPSRDTVLYPEVAYPTYAMGATFAGGRALPVPAKADGSMDLGAIDPADAARAICLWVNSPANPTGELDDLAAAAAWGRSSAVPVLSDECYCEFTWADRPRTILEHGMDGVLAVHSLSKRSNLAGLRVGFYAGDPDLVAYLRVVRQHAGMMVPGPAQAAAVAALDDDAHVEVQRETYLRRLGMVAEGLIAAGFEVRLPKGSFYLWVVVPPRLEDGWAMARELAERAGMVVSPGDLYGEAARGFIRIAVVQPDERLELAMGRLAASPRPA